jgi:malate/lactate dehydrogenase
VPVDIDKDGVKQVYGIGRLSDYERTLLTKAVTDLRADISKGAKFMQET